MHAQAKTEFKAGRIVKAIELFTHALKLEPESVIFLSNRSQCYLNICCGQLALEDANRALELQPAHSKSIYRRCRALLMLNRPSDALKFLDQSQDSDACFELRNKLVIAERENRGVYDMKALKAEAAQSTSGDVPFHHCEFESPGMELFEASSTKGRGYRATQVFRPAQLLMVSRAFAFSAKSPLMTSIDFTTNSFNVGANSLLESVTIQKLQEDPERGAALYNLYAGPEFAPLDDEQARHSVDIPRIRGILMNNWFGIHEASTFDSVVKDQHQMESTGRHSVGSAAELEAKREFDDKFGSGTGLWLKPSMFNHSCTPNCTYSFVGDFMFLHTTREVRTQLIFCLLNMKSHV